MSIQHYSKCYSEQKDAICVLMLTFAEMKVNIEAQKDSSGAYRNLNVQNNFPMGNILVSITWLVKAVIININKLKAFRTKEEHKWKAINPHHIKKVVSPKENNNHSYN